MRRMLLLALGFCLVATAAAAQGLPDYPREVDLLVDTPGTTRSVAGGLFNPAAWSVHRDGGLFLGFRDGAGDLSRDDYTGVLSLRYLGFGMRQFRFEPAPGDEVHVRDYMLGISAGTGGGSLGVGYGWGGGDTERVPRHERFVAGAVARSRPLSLGLAWTRDLEIDDNSLQADAGIRPFGPRLTLFGDAVYRHGQSFENIECGYGAEAWPLAGLVLGVKARTTGEVSFRVGLALGRRLEVGFRPHLNDGGDRVASTYAIEVGSTELATLGSGWERARKYPTLRLRGRTVHQTYRYFDERQTLLDRLTQIQAVADDPRAGGVVVDLSGAQIGSEMMWELREQLAGLRAQGKKVIVYVDRAGLRGMMLASVADAIWMDPAGELDLRGVAMGRTFMRHALDKIGLGVDEWRFFTYKSAFESLSRDSMSDPDREQRQALADDFYEEFAATVTTARGLSRNDWDEIVDEKGVLQALEARAAGLVDSLGTLQDAQKAARQTPVRAHSDLSTAVLPGVTGDAVWGPLEWGLPPRIAILYAIGPCAMETGIRGRRLSQAIRAAAKDRRVEAIVLRVDSPGGDILPSDLVAREVAAAAKKKPFIVSQGGVAASGGYWISMLADTIVAAPTTVTGSIGVIGGWIWNKELSEKIGFDYDGVKRGRSADAGEGIGLPLVGAIPDRPLSAEERDRVETLIRNNYKVFVGKVAAGRGLDETAVDAIAQGRVWTGRRAVKNGLVDELGGLWRSLQIAKDAAGLPDDRTIEIVEGPSIGSIDFDRLRMRFIGAGDATAETTTFAVTPDAIGAAAAGLTPAETDFLRAIVAARGRPLVRMEPFEIDDGTPAELCVPEP